jgi:hypothetical protein
LANNLIYVKRTTVSGRTPNTTGSYATNTQYISTGELALNLSDNKLFSSNGTTYFEIGSNTTDQNVSNTLTVKAISANGSNGTAGQVLTTNGTGTYWSTVTGGSGSLTVRSTYGNGGTVNTTVTSVTAINFDESTGLHVTDQGSGNVFVSLGSGFKYITVAGQTTITAVGEDTLAIANGSLVTLTTSNSAPKTLTIDLSANVVTNAQLSGNLSSYQTTAGMSSYQTTAGLSSNVATLTSNNTSFVGTVSAANVVSNAQLSGNLANYVNTSGAYTFTGIHTHTANVSVNAAIIANGSVGTSGQVLTSSAGGNVYWSTVTSSGGSSVTVSDTAPSTPASGDLWYYTGTGELLVYYNDGTSSQWVTASATYVPTTFSTLTVTGPTTLSGNVTISNTVTANASTGTAGQVLTSSGAGANVYWSTPSSGVTTGKAIAMAIVFGG